MIHSATYAGGSISNLDFSQVARKFQNWSNRCVKHFDINYGGRFRDWNYVFKQDYRVRNLFTRSNKFTEFRTFIFSILIQWKAYFTKFSH